MSTQRDRDRSERMPFAGPRGTRLHRPRPRRPRARRLRDPRSHPPRLSVRAPAHRRPRPAGRHPDDHDESRQRLASASQPPERRGEREIGSGPRRPGRRALAEDAGQDGAQALLVLDAVAAAPAQRSLCRACASAKAIARAPPSSSPNSTTSYHLLKPGQRHRRPRRGARRLVAGARRSGSAPTRGEAASSRSTFSRWSRCRASPSRRWTFSTTTRPTASGPCCEGRADGVISDMAANATGHRKTDHLKIVALVELAAAFAAEVLKPGGFFLAKVLQGGTEGSLLADAEARLRAGPSRQAASQPGRFGRALRPRDRVPRAPASRTASAPTSETGEPDPGA